LDEELSARDIGVVCCPKELKGKLYAHIASKDAIAPFFGADMALFAAENAGLSLSSARFLLIDGSSPYSLLALERLGESAEHISVFSRRSAAFEKISEELLEKRGLALSVFSSVKSPDAAEADVILSFDPDVGGEQRIMASRFRSGAIFIAPGQKTLKTAAAQRRDISIYTLPSFLADGKELSAENIYAAEFAANPSFRVWAASGYPASHMNAFARSFLRRKLDIGGLYTF
ncbi:MAG: hypothetical protein IJC39_01310, partial [Firmicutes bacterium]|nr:hypothetical protein [Bacillota bacterium]